MKGLFITFEGIEGSGKTTIVGLLQEYLREKGHEVVTTFEPGDHPLGRAIRGLLLEPETSPEDLTELFLYMADRAEHVRKIIKPALAQGRVVLCDRFADSTVAYQGYGRGLDIQMIETLNRMATGGLSPDRTYLLDLAPEKGLSRNVSVNKSDRFERESLEFHQRVRQGYLEIARGAPERVRLIDADRTIEEVFSEIRDDVLGMLA